MKEEVIFYLGCEDTKGIKKNIPVVDANQIFYNDDMKASLLKFGDNKGYYLEIEDVLIGLDGSPRDRKGVMKTTLTNDAFTALVSLIVNYVKYNEHVLDGVDELNIRTKPNYQT